jgi:hypothetical protein
MTKEAIEEYFQKFKDQEKSLNGKTNDYISDDNVSEDSMRQSEDSNCSA